MSPRSEPVTVGFLHNSGLSRPNTSYLWKSNRKNKEMFLLCGKGVILSWGNPKRLKVDVRAWTVSTFSQTAGVPISGFTQFKMYVAPPQSAFAEDSCLVPTAASILSIYPSGTRLAILYVQFKAEVRPHIWNSMSWVFLPNGNPITSQQIIALYDVFNTTQKAWKEDFRT